MQGKRLIKANTITGLRRIIDFSSDSARNFIGVGIVDARAGLLATNITVNGLPILNDATENPLAHICTDQVIGGPGTFVVAADICCGFADAVRRKLILETAAAIPIQVAADQGQLSAAAMR